MTALRTELKHRFNPLPPTVGGRMPGREPGREPRAGFNPLPPTVGGRMAIDTGDCSHRRFQSAPADCRRENANRSLPDFVERNRFNPLPPTVGGRMRWIRLALTAVLVSIRSRRLSAGESSVVEVPPGGERVSIRSRRLSAGESRLRTDLHDRRRVSIRSRRLSAGESMPSAAHTTGFEFQSAPADCRRENASTGSRVARRHSFQSAPADCRRENDQACPRVYATVSSFNPLPPTVGGRMSIALASIRRWPLFQSAPADCRRENLWPVPATARRFAGFNPLPPTVGGRM